MLTCVIRDQIRGWVVAISLVWIPRQVDRRRLSEAC